MGAPEVVGLTSLDLDGGARKPPFREVYASRYGISRRVKL